MTEDIKEYEALDLIRLLSGMFEKNEDHMANRLALINLIARGIIGDADRGFVEETILKAARAKVIWDKEKSDVVNSES